MLINDPLKMAWVYYCVWFFLLCDSINSTILLYDTNNNHETQAYDCIYYDGGGEIFYNNVESVQSIKYCVRSAEFVSVQRNYSLGCLNSGILVSFDVLKQNNITTQQLLRWKSGVSAIDRYRAYLANHQLGTNEQTENFICNCTNFRTFGVLCEYQFIKGSFEGTIYSQHAQKVKYILGSQLFGTTTCYNTSFACDYGQLCLDWRNICDGNQNCVDGTDEEHCGHLLLNECNPETEYRCRNGMCIDVEYFLDGDIDCQDQSDEQRQTIYATTIACFSLLKLDCDEKILENKQEISCGDGSRMFVQQLYRQSSVSNIDRYCFSFRDRQWRCELNDRDVMWTNPDNGHCLDYVDSTTKVGKEKNDCIFIHKCALTKKGQHYLCPCTGNGCRTYFYRYCGSNNVSLFAYPSGRIFSPFVETYYKSDVHDFDRNRWPDVFSFTRSIKCNNEMWATPDITNQNYWLYNETEVYRAVRSYSIHPLEILLCKKYQSINVNKTNYGNCWNDLYPNQAKHCRDIVPYECISKYHVKDGLYDCPRSVDEKMENWFEDCSSIQKHRFRCSETEQNCLTVGSIGDKKTDCKINNHDEHSTKYNIELNHLKCISRDSVDCTFLRQYIAESPILDTNTTEKVHNAMKFWNYCNSYWEKSYGEDEIDCNQWKCPSHYSVQRFYQCRTGQCIPNKILCDGEWDCSDGSDEEGIQLLTEDTVGEHNLKVFQVLGTNLTEQKNRCLKKNSERPFIQFCDLKREYPCLLANVDDALNFRLNRPCINLTQLGDGRVDCYGGLDERNILNCSSFEQLGFGFKCDMNDKCIRRKQQCTYNHRCFNGNDRLLCIYLYNNSYVRCDGKHSNTTVNDIHCFNGTCLPNSRCNGLVECPFGEDEYYCPTGSSAITSSYRPGYRMSVLLSTKIKLPNYTPFSFLINKSIENNEKNRTLKSSETSMIAIQHQSSSKVSSRQALANQYSEEGWICNRGIAALKTLSAVNQLIVQCFCPPSYYGERCEFMSDRLTVFIRFGNETNNFSKDVIKILALFVVIINHTETVLDRHEVNFTPALDNFKEKQKFYFVYPRPHQLRSKVHHYAVRFEAYQLNEDDNIEFIAVWIYPVPFDFLPSQRLAKVLKYTQQSQIESNHTCLSKTNPCLNGGRCHPIMNKLTDIHSYWCQCENDSYGSHCQFKDQSCFISSTKSNYCSPTSLCRPQYDRYGQKPFCICSMNSYGPHCFIDRQCQMKIGKNPCLNGGICFTKYQYYDLIDDYICKCPMFYFGSICQYPSGSIEISYISHNESTVNSSGNQILATVIQLFNVSDLGELNLKKQVLYKGNLPYHLTITSENTYHPVLGLIKLYTNQSTIQHHLLYTISNSTAGSSLNLTLTFNEENYCPHTHDIFNLSNETYQIRNVVAKYHTLCNKATSNISSLLCFFDDDYFCLCDVNDTAQCFFNQKLDQCKQCLAQGQCIKGDINTPSDYLCLCPRCHFGSKCQHNTQLFSFTLDTLISPDILSSSKIKQKVSISMYIIVPALLFIYGTIGNLFSFATFRRPKTRQNGAGYYFYSGAVFSQLSLFCLLSKVLHLIINIRGLFIQPTVNIVLCKMLSFMLSSSTRICYWLIVFVTIERLYITVYPTKRWLQQPKIAKIIIMLITVSTFASHVHESIKYTIVDDPKYTANGKWCVTQFSHSLQIYNQINTMIHYLASFLITLICTIILMILIVRSRANADKKKSLWETFQEQFKKKKDMFIPPMTVIISALPHIIISFSLGCTDLDTKWERYILIIAYFSAYIPQSLSFHLYVQPSKFFLQEFHATKVWKMLRRQPNVKT